MITEIRARLWEIPFKQRFRHAAANRTFTQTIWVEAISDSGMRGLGESCPREYVTGESIVSSLDFIGRIEPEVRRIRNLAELKLWVKPQADLIDAHPAAWCAIELAVLDLLAREENRSVESLLGLPSIAGSF